MMFKALKAINKAQLILLKNLPEEFQINYKINGIYYLPEIDLKY